MNTLSEKHNTTRVPRRPDLAGVQGKSLPAVPVLQPLRDEAGPQNAVDTVQRRPAVVQMAPPLPGRMKAEAGELQANYDRKLLVDRMYALLKKKFKQSDINTETDVLKYFGDKDATGAVFTLFKAAEKGEKEAMASELLGRILHDRVADEEIPHAMRANLGKGLDADHEGAGEIQDPDIAASTVAPGDIKSNMDNAKACVITALMFAEGGSGVLGAKSIEELHFILSTRFKTTWRHYSEDAVFESLYKFMGYTKAAPVAPASLSNLSLAIGAHTVGVASIDGHMIGFKKDGATLYIRDNDEGLKLPAAHTKAGSPVISIWY